MNDVQRLIFGHVIDTVPAFLETDDPNVVMDVEKAKAFGTDAIRAMKTAGLVKDSPMGGGEHWDRNSSQKADAKFFLNRIFSIPLKLQSQIFNLFDIIVAKIKSDLVRSGGLSEGIVDVAGDNFELDDRKIIAIDADTKATTELITYISDRGKDVG